MRIINEKMQDSSVNPRSLMVSLSQHTETLCIFIIYFSQILMTKAKVAIALCNTAVIFHKYISHQYLSSHFCLLNV